MGLKHYPRAILPLCVMLLGTACSDNSDNLPGPSLDELLAETVSAAELTGDPSTGRTLPDISDPLAQLGMKLFFSKALGGETDSSCVTCHHPTLGGGDNLSLPIGVQAELPDQLGPGRMHSSSGFGYDGGPTVPRNAPTTYNIGLWDQVLFHDGRVESLGKTPGAGGDDGQGIRTPDSPFGQADAAALNLPQAQALFPVTSPEEMRAELLAGDTNDVVRDALAARLVLQVIPNTWLGEFQQAFNSNGSAAELMTYENISIAIGAYEASQVFVDTPWRNYLEGDSSALDDSAKRGALLFLNNTEAGGANCAACHSGDFFTDEGFHVLAVPQIGRGKGDGPNGDDDFGRFRESGVEADRYAFRTPALLSVSTTGPWGHAGAHLTLQDIVRHHADPATAIDMYDFSLAELQPGMQGSNAEANTRAALTQLQALQSSGDSQLSTLALSDAEIDDLVAFLQSLTDPCIEDAECIGQWVPDTSDAGPDGLQLNGVDEGGNLL